MKSFVHLKNMLEDIPDPRVIGRTSHNLVDILALTIIAYICGARTWPEVEYFGNGRLDYLKKLLSLKSRIPSHDTISRVFSLIDTSKFESIFIAWVAEVRKKKNMRDVICIDGKRLKGTYRRGKMLSCSTLNIVNAFSTEESIVLGQRKSGLGGGLTESISARTLISVLNLENMVVVGDAGIGTIQVAKDIVDKGGDYIFPVKGNNSLIQNKIKMAFKNLEQQNKEDESLQKENHCKHLIFFYPSRKNRTGNAIGHAAPLRLLE